MRRALLTLFTLFLFTHIHALTLKPGAPTRYIVKRGDTLWSIANHYLEKPWEWRQLWTANPQIKNPERLEPGAVLVLRYEGEQPYIRVLSHRGGTIRLSPHIRVDGSTNAIPAIPLEPIKSFLDESIVMDKEHDELVNAPYVVEYSGEHLMAGQGNEVYVKNLHPAPMPLDGITTTYAVFRPGGPYIHPSTKNILGYKATRIGHGILSKGGEPALMLLTSINMGVLINDRVLPNNFPEFDLYFHPRAPAQPIRGKIIDMPDNHTQEAWSQVIVLDIGENAGLKPGDVLGIFSKSHQVTDPQTRGELITIPPERLGEAMIFRTFSLTSFALIVRSIRPVYIMDSVGNP